MEYINKINNNVALAKDAGGNEWVLLAKGIGFGHKSGDNLSDIKIDRKFRAETNEATHQSPPAMLANIDPNILQLAEGISKNAEQSMGIQFSNYNYLALADHLAYAIEREQSHKDYPREMRWDVKQLFPKEYSAAKMAIDMVNEHTGVSLPASELTFLTYHFVSAQSDETLIEDTVEMTSLINRIIEIISYYFQMKLDSSSLNYARFMTHLRFFIVRQMRGEGSDDEIDAVVGQVVRDKYPKAYQAASKLAEYLHQKRGWNVSDSEKMYLALHVWRLTRE